MHGGTETLVCVTYFKDYAAAEKREARRTLGELVDEIAETSAPQKDDLPWVKLASFGNRRTDKNSLRHDANVVSVFGVEADYDGEKISFETAVEIATKAGLLCIIYTSPSHTEDSPRWRVLCPFSEALTGTQRGEQLGRLNGLYKGIFSSESWALSQSYYFGSVNKNPSHKVELVEGEPIDLLDELDNLWTGKPDTGPAKKTNGTHYSGKLDEAAAMQQILSGQSFHRAQVSLLGKWAFQGVPMLEARNRISLAMDGFPDAAKDKRWRDRFGDINRLVFDIYGREAAKKDEVEELERIQAKEKEKPSPNQQPSLPVVYFADIQPSIDAQDFVEGVLLHSAMSVVYGQSNSGKTFFCCDLALHVACGKPWNGREVEHLGVLWVAMEGAYGIRNRVTAWREKHGMDSAAVHFAYIPCTLNMLDPEADASKLIQTISVVSARMGVRLGLVVMDTLARAMAGGNENSSEDMGALVINGASVQQATGAHVMWIHHSGKDEAKGARGHSSLRAATDTEIEISAEGAQRVARVTKQREMECAGEFSFTLNVVELGANRRGKEVTSCVVVHSDQTAGAVPDRQTRLRGHPKRALEVLTGLVASSGKTGWTGTPSGANSVPEKWWRDRFYEAAMPGEDQGTKQKAFRRAADELLNSHVVGMACGRVWVSSQVYNPGHKPGQENGHDDR